MLVGGLLGPSGATVAREVCVNKWKAFWFLGLQSGDGDDDGTDDDGEEEEDDDEGDGDNDATMGFKGGAGDDGR